MSAFEATNSSRIVSFTLATSVTTAFGNLFRAETIVAAVTSGGIQTTTTATSSLASRFLPAPKSIASD